MLEKEHQITINTAPGRKNSNLLIGAGIATVLALSALAYGVHQRQEAQIEARANWENV